MPPASTRGSTVLEVVVALAILAGVLVSLPGVLLQAARATAAARRSVVASIAAADKLEQLRGLAWGFDADGAPIEDAESDITRSPVSPSGGAGMTASTANSLEADVPGFVDYLDADGEWMASAGAAGASLIRRWSVAPAPAGPADTLVLEVRVFAVTGADGHGLTEAARLATLKSRRAR